MTRVAAITSHLAVLPAAVLLSIGLARVVPGATPQAVDVHLDDTFFVVAHLHVTVMVVVSVLAVSAVAYSFRTTNGLLATSWRSFSCISFASLRPRRVVELALLARACFRFLLTLVLASLTSSPQQAAFSFSFCFWG
jgi:hypothetical protein